MGFWIFMMSMDLLMPLVMLGFGKMFLSGNPKEINFVFGYRTSMSVKNKDTWQFAHSYCGKLWFRIGLILLPVSVIPLLFVINGNMNTVAIVGGIVEAVQVVVLLCSIIPVEKALKRTFDRNGNRKKAVKNC